MACSPGEQSPRTRDAASLERYECMWGCGLAGKEMHDTPLGIWKFLMSLVFSPFLSLSEPLDPVSAFPGEGKSLGVVWVLACVGGFLEVEKKR